MMTLAPPLHPPRGGLGRGRWTVSAIFLSCCLSVAGCTSSQQTLEAGQRPTKESLEGGLWMAVERAERSLQTSGKVIDDPSLQTYVNQVACRVAPDYCDDVRVFVVRQSDFNAGMYPNGAMVVWSGLLLRLTNEAQLATVLGHEVAHYARRHSLQRWEELRTTASLAMLFRFATAVAGVGQAGLLGDLAAAGYLASFSRENEREADDLGFDMMVAAGYDVREAPKVWAGMVAEKAVADRGNTFPFLASHPPSNERLADLTDLALWHGTSTGADTGERTYLKQIKDHRGDWLDDELDLRRWKRTEIILDRLTEQGFQPGELAFYRGELHRRRAGSGDRAAAAALFRQAIQTRGAPIAAHRSLGLVLWDLGDEAGARRAFRTYLSSKAPLEDRAMIQSYLDRLGG